MTEKRHKHKTMLKDISPSRLVAWADEDHPGKPLYYRVLHAFCRTFLLSVREFNKNELALRSAALTFTVMLSLVPILAMSTAVVKGLGGSDQLKQVVFNYLETIDNGGGHPDDATQDDTDAGEEILLSSYTQHLYSAVERIFDYVDNTNFTTLGTIGVAGLILSVVLVLGNIEMAMNAIWHVDSGRSVTRKISDYLALLVLMPISLNIGLAANTVLTNDTLLLKFSILLPMEWIQALVLKFIPVFFLALTLYVIYLFFPNTKVKTIPAMIGAVFAGFFWFEAQNLYIVLQVGVSRYNAIYGSFATLPLFLIWLYLGWIFILLGAQIAYAYQNKASLRLVQPMAPPSLRLAIAYDFLDYVQESYQRQEPATVVDFGEHYPMYRLSIVEETLDQLKEHNLVHLTAEQSSIMPSAPRENLERGKIIGAIMGSIYSETAGGRVSRKILNTPAALGEDTATEGQAEDAEEKDQNHANKG